MARAPATIEEPASDEREGAIPPREARGVEGHAAAEKSFIDSWRSGRLHHAWLIAGQEGIGKASFAWLAARFLLEGGPNLEQGRFHPDFESKSNRLLSARSHPDFYLSRRRWNEKTKRYFSDIQVEDIRDMKAHFQLAPAMGGHRVAIIDSCDDLNGSSANALLKLLEEPPAGAVLLLVCHKPHRLLPTIRSRCRRLDLADLDEAAVARILARQPAAAEASREAISEAARLGQGSISRAMRFLDPGARDARSKSEAMLRDLPRLDAGRWMALSRELTKKDSDAFGIFIEAAEEFAAGQARSAPDPSRRAALAEAHAGIGAAAREAETFNLDFGGAALAILQRLQSALR